MSFYLLTRQEFGVIGLKLRYSQCQWKHWVDMFLYGMSVGGFVSYALSDYGKVYTEDEAEAMRDGYFNTYAGYRRYQVILLRKARLNGCVYVRWNGKKVRRRWLPDITSKNRTERGHAERACLNTPIQGGASEYTLRSLIVLHKMWRSGELPGLTAIFGTVHDSIWMSVRRDCMQSVFDKAARVMVSLPTLRGVPLEVEGKMGPSLGDMEEFAILNSLDL